MTTVWHQTAEARWRHLTRTPLLIVTAVGWTGLVALSAVDRSHMAGMNRSPSAPMNADMGPGWGTTALATGVMTGLMVLAMMTPLAVAVVRHVMARSLPRRRVRAVTTLLAPHLLIWLAGGLGLLLLAQPLVTRLSDPELLTLGVSVVLVWQASPAAQQCRNGHHAEPAIAAFGTDADRDVLRLGSRHASYCLAGCWDLMLLAFLVPDHQLLVMGLSSAWVWAQALERPTRPRWRLPLPLKTARLLRHVAQHLEPARVSPRP